MWSENDITSVYRQLQLGISHAQSLLRECGIFLMNIVVTGLNSFLGRHLLPFLAGRGATIFATYRTPDGSLHPLRALSRCTSYTTRTQSTGRQIAAASGCFAPPRRKINSYFEGHRRNRCGRCNGAKNLARYTQAVRYTQAAGVKTMLYTSTISIYGDIRVQNVDETYRFTNPSDYGLTKYVAERIFAETPGLPCVALRLPGILGKGAHRAWLPSLLLSVLNGQRQVRVYGPKSLFNNAAHVTEISEFIWLLLNRQMSGFKAVNIAADNSITIREIIDLMADVLGEKIETKVIPAAKPSFMVSSERAKGLGCNTRSIKEILQCYFEESGLSQVKTHMGVL